MQVDIRHGTDDIRHSSIKENCVPWTPYASLAARYFYRALDGGLMRDVELNAKLREIGR